MRMYRTGAILGALLVALLTVTACSPRAGSGGKAPDRPTPWTMPTGPGGYGGRLLGARWRVDWVTVDGRNIDAPPDAGAWVEFGYDNTAVGDYGCTPFKSSATVTATTLTVGTDTSGVTPDDACPAKERAFEQRMRKIFTGGPLAVAERVDEFSMTLKNQRGDYVALQMLWPQGLFGAPWRIEYLNVADTPVDMTAGKEVYFVFHRDGTVTGKGGCNGFKGRAAFAGEHVTLYPLTRTTHRTCSRKIMSQEDGLLDQDPRTFSVVASRGITFVDRTPGLDGLAYNFIRVR
ncbi:MULTISPECIES: META domain-containing protein [Streptomyces]|uniref:META domain-containing protein n=1 Tax=Streptomyces TaxID=1883 RepID=UPI001162A7F0|nr:MULTISPECIES: META domain-containing protein [unclassified Streptomyces]NMI58925.1 META domain-containing protein [Streptomyces sp. RLA2-12]QDN58219.1 META domain-containing protein [Streptomyces sp. S1D4-20]QDN68313.1 META domain-containing protein [Streptomyces sp. S1D4-14]QDO50730.1 META domain-containing protein [Streptomyces sp. RLB3-5]QDO60970.1 META domain-containing protein [Streptomyces sp. RLB1-8]